MPPRIIAGRYAVERAVGHGGMGTVWLCRDEVLGRSVAVKQVGNMPGETTSDVNRALREARSSSALNHPNVVSIYDAVEDGDHNWLVMEYVPSRTLAEILTEEGSITPERATWIGAQAADGLAVAHERGTMHRDVKPSNILVTDNDHVKITDFGISRTHGDDQLTRTGLITGTPAFFSPEIARGLEPGLEADVWALGATLYAAVEGHPPYAEQGNAIALLTRIAAEPALPATSAGVLAEAIGRMMDRDPATRWSMADAARALHRLRAQLADTARPERTVTLTAPVAAPPPPTPQATPEPAPTPEPTRERPRPVPDDDRRRRGWLVPLAAVLLLVLAAVAGVLLLTGNDDEDPPAADSAVSSSADGSDDPTTDDEPVETASEPPVESSTPPPPEETETETEPAEVPAAGDPRAFGEEYYGLLPDDTESAYALLSPAYQASTSFGAYQGFWSTISAVTVRDATAVDGENAVDVDITYTTSNGSTEDETRRLFLEQTDEGYRIVDDSAV